MSLGLVYYGWAELLRVGLTDTYAAMAGLGTAGRRTVCCFAVRGMAAVEWGILYLQERKVRPLKPGTMSIYFYVFICQYKVERRHRVPKNLPSYLT